MNAIDLITSGAPRRDPVRMSAQDALALFDQLAPCHEHELRGRWVGREVHSGHPLDGSPANVAWYGKQFDSPTEVHPLVVADSAGQPFPLNPAVVPMLLISHPVDTPCWVKTFMPHVVKLLRPVVHARGYGARLEVINHRGVSTTSMSYNDRPVVDIFRAVDENTVLGMMEYDGMPRPHFFVLRRDDQGENDVR